MLMKRAPILLWMGLGTAAFAAPLLGCAGTASVAVVPAPDTGTLTVDWTVSSSTDPSECSTFGAVNLELLVYDDSGTLVAQQDAPCDAFSDSVALDEGTYSATATLVSGTDAAVTTSVPLSDLDIVAGTDLAVAVDFPATSLL
jgi:hypothetical protein